MKHKTIIGLLWSFLERSGTQVVSFVVSIVLARILSPDDYGLLAIVLVFVNICDVFVISGMGSALVQKKEVDEGDFSSIFWLSLLISIILYLILFITSPLIARFYNNDILSPILRVLGLKLFFSPFNTVQRAIVSRSMQFKTYFYGSMSAVVVSAVVGILMATKGYGVWSLVGQQLSNTVISTLVIALIVHWFPKCQFVANKVKELFSFAWKLLVGQLIDVVYDEFRSLVIGKLYTPADLAYYTRGRQFPQLIVTNINASISTVLFPALSANQDNIDRVRNMTRRAIKTSSYLITPMLFGMMAVAKPLVLLILTEKWLFCVPFLQIMCLDFVLMPIQTANLQAIYAMGRSDIGLRLNIIKKSVGFVLVLLGALYSVKAMAWCGVLASIFASIINSHPNKKLLGYGYFEQIKDILPNILMSVIMAGIVLLMNYLPLEPIILLALQIIAGCLVYLIISIILKVESFHYILDILKNR